MSIATAILAPASTTYHLPNIAATAPPAIDGARKARAAPHGTTSARAIYSRRRPLACAIRHELYAERHAALPAVAYHNNMPQYHYRHVLDVVDFAALPAARFSFVFTIAHTFRSTGRASSVNFIPGWQPKSHYHDTGIMVRLMRVTRDRVPQ